MKNNFKTLIMVILLMIIQMSCQNSSEKNSQTAMQGLLQRLLPEHTDRFEFVVIDQESGHDVFEIESMDERIVIRGNNGVSMAMGLNWYLKYYANCDVSLFGNQLDLPEKMPQVNQKVRQVSQEKYRYMLNYCSFGYTMPWYDWAQWEKLIDWMALNGINLPLAMTGQEAVWREVGKRLDITDLTNFFAGPPYLPFSWMGCLDGWGGPLPENWIDRHRDLQNKILARERELGMTPVLQGFTGHIPEAFVEKFPDSKVKKINWIEWETYILDPLDPLFKMIGNLFLEEQEKLYGTDHLYAADTFIEMIPPSGDPDYLRQMARSILEGMTGYDPQAIWILQGWAFSAQQHFWIPERLEAFLTAIPNEHIILLDLFCEKTEMWNQTQAFYGKPWLWCNIQTFGANVDMHGPLNRINNRLQIARTSEERGERRGLGFVNEGFEGNPVVYEFLTELAWHDSAVDLDKWMDDYVKARYGKSNDIARQAWTNLLESTYSDSLLYGVFLSANRFPRLKLHAGLPYETIKVVEAWEFMLKSAEIFKNTETYTYDLVSIGVQVLANFSYDLHQEMIRLFKEKNMQKFRATSRLFLQVLKDLDELAGTHRQFLLGRWLADARRWGETEEEKDRLEWNARRILTLWGSGTNLRDYSRRNWSGMFSGFYRPRWKRFIEEMKNSLETGTTFDEKKINQELLEWERAWTEKHDVYPAEPKGDYLEVSRRLWRKYKSKL